ncbi:FkbM family methyltransferase [Hansschlegelia plantiphila]|nr:FkbM family methyltransferase [Hansschlegelia plantiphila]
MIRMVSEAPLYRRNHQKSDYARPTFIVCDVDEMEKASKWFKSAAGRNAEFIGGLQGQRDLTVIGNVDVQQLRERPELAVVAFGRQVRRKCIGLALNGFRNVLFREDQKYRGGRTQFNFLEKNGSALSELFDLLADDESRLTLSSIIRHRISGDHGFLRIADYPEYNHPQVRALGGYAVIDAGAYDGRTSLDFARGVGAGGKVYAFEPDRSNVKRIERALADELTADHGTVEIVEAALTDQEGFVRLKASASGSSNIDDDGDTIVRSTSVDSFLSEDASRRCDLISIDVEGFEQAVLSGAKDTLASKRPMLQVSIYHSIEHLFEIPLSLAKILPDYKFYLGHHNSYSTESDLYAVPVERVAS